MTKFNLFFVACAMVLLSACGKVKGGEFKQGEYNGNYKVYKNGNVVFASGYELEFKKDRYEGEIKSQNVSNKETKGTFKVSKKTIQFNPDYIIQPGELSFTLVGKYNYEYQKDGKKLYMERTDGIYKYEYNLVRTDD